MSSLTSIDLKLPEKLKDPEYRTGFFREWSEDELADQLWQMREKRADLKQEDFASRAGMQQSAISRFFRKGYRTVGFQNLLRIAAAMDARVRIILEPAEDVIASYSDTEVRTDGVAGITSVRDENAHRSLEGNRHADWFRQRTPPPPSRDLLLGGPRLAR